ncbi:MAG: chemotaxis protein CheW [Acidobacteriota bacterium]
MAETIITFESRSDLYGLPARDILEVAPLKGLRPVPRSPRIVAGLAEIHGRIVTLIDLDRVLGGPGPAALPAAEDAGEAGRVGGAGLGVVLAPPLDHLGILVRSDVDVAPSDGSARPSGLPDEGGLLRARVPVGDRLLNLLFLPALVSRVEEALRDGFKPGPSGPGGEG